MKFRSAAVLSLKLCLGLLLVWGVFVISHGEVSSHEIVLPFALPVALVYAAIKGNIHNVDEADLLVAFAPGFLLGWATVTLVLLAVRKNVNAGR